LQDALRECFEITVNEGADNNLSVKLERLVDGSVNMTQSKLLQRMFEKCHFESMPKIKCPLVSLCSFRSDETIEEEYAVTEEVRNDYLHLFGTVNYLTRPDLRTTSSSAAVKSINPTAANFERP
jgi:hypothetical protein